MKNSEIIALSLEELKEKLTAESTNMQNLRFAHAITPLENPMRIRVAKREIARINTEIRRRQLEANSK